eukprot:1769151-Rhodomonas_salina.1
MGVQAFFVPMRIPSARNWEIVVFWRLGGESRKQRQFQGSAKLGYKIVEGRKTSGKPLGILRGLSADFRLSPYAVAALLPRGTRRLRDFLFVFCYTEPDTIAFRRGSTNQTRLLWVSGKHRK